MRVELVVTVVPAGPTQIILADDPPAPPHASQKTCRPVYRAPQTTAELPTGAGARWVLQPQDTSDSAGSAL